MALNVNGFFPGELKSTQTPAPCIEIYENAWPNPNVTINMAEKEASDSNSGVFWERAGTIGSGPYQEIRTNKLMAITHLADIANNPALQNIHNQFYIMLLAATHSYIKKYSFDEGLWHEPYQMLKYEGGEFYKAHYDGGSDIGRAISAVVYLNDDYEGGEIEFVNFNLKIKPKAGSLILFPSNYSYRHVAHEIKNGTKYVLVTWIKDRQK